MISVLVVLSFSSVIMDGSCADEMVVIRMDYCPPVELTETVPGSVMGANMVGFCKLDFGACA
jgi:hypothetical protein